MAEKLVKVAELAEKNYWNYLQEWADAHEMVIPQGARIKEQQSFASFCDELSELETDAARRRGWVPAALFALINGSGEVLGVAQLRYELNADLLRHGGHIGYGVRPSERRKGYASQLLTLTLNEAKRIGLPRVLVTCDKTNIGSARTIVKNGGQLENEINESNRMTQRYWIELNR
ncbi:MAG: GNAT family N-acetyltransferase [Sporolactobacillus sp.]